jgi:hypothetical protein
MSRANCPVVEAERSVEAGPQRNRSPYEYWPPRLSTVVAALFVGSSLFFIIFVDVDFYQYGWPLSHHLTPRTSPASSGSVSVAALAADLVISAALLASACVTTQVAACLLVRSPRLTVRILGFVVIVIAMLLAACRWKANYFTYVLYGGFFYSVASLAVLVVSVLLRLELPRVEDPEQRA